MRRPSAVLVVVTAIALTRQSAAGDGGAAPEPERPEQAAVRRLVEQVGADANVSIESEVLGRPDLTAQFYAARDFRPAWLAGGATSEAPLQLMGAVRNVDADGLDPSAYHVSSLERLTNSLPRLDAEGRAALDVLLTDGFLSCARHLLAGRLDPVSAGIAWSIDRPTRDLPALLAEALGTGRVSAALDGLRPQDPAYARLRKALAEYRALAARGGWTALPSGPPLRQGDTDTRVSALRARLSITGERAPAATGDLFDEALSVALQQFQRRHGLDPDGVLGPRTLAALNRPVSYRVQQIVANLERWRWLPLTLGRRYLWVNIAAFRLDVVENGRSVLAMKAVVGLPYRQTPIFAAKMTYLVFGPYWNVPDRIAREEILPKARRSPAFLAREGIRIFRGWSADARPISPWRVAWGRLSARHFPFRLRQDPGAQNPLGGVKFMLPNPFDVYLHDTPAHHLFERPSRPFSHGCVRLERAADLAAYLLSGDPEWGRQAIDTAMADAVDRAVTLPSPVDVYFLYWTAWAGDDGVTSFRDDVYQRDAALTRALEAVGQHHGRG